MVVLTVVYSNPRCRPFVYFLFLPGISVHQQNWVCALKPLRLNMIIMNIRKLLSVRQRTWKKIYLNNTWIAKSRYRERRKEKDDTLSVSINNSQGDYCERNGAYYKNTTKNIFHYNEIFIDTDQGCELTATFCYLSWTHVSLLAHASVSSG